MKPTKIPRPLANVPPEKPRKVFSRVITDEEMKYLYEGKCNAFGSTKKSRKPPAPWKNWLDFSIAQIGSQSTAKVLLDHGHFISEAQDYARLELAALRKAKGKGRKK